jgi:hypothetical protein
MRKLINFVITYTLVALIALIGAFLLVEWFAGCGESYIAADGKRYPYECFFLK